MNESELIERIRERLLRNDPQRGIPAEVIPDEIDSLHRTIDWALDQYEAALARVKAMEEIAEWARTAYDHAEMRYDQTNGDYERGAMYAYEAIADRLARTFTQESTDREDTDA